MRRVLLVCAALVMMAVVSPAAVQAAEQSPSCQATLDSYMTLTVGTKATPERVAQENVLMTKYLADSCDGQAFVDGAMALVVPELRPLVGAALGLGENPTNYQIYCATSSLALATLMTVRDGYVGTEFLAQIDLMIENRDLAMQIGGCATPERQVH